VDASASRQAIGPKKNEQMKLGKKKARLTLHRPVSIARHQDRNQATSAEQGHPATR
jgi:hypothetical protein